MEVRDWCVESPRSCTRGRIQTYTKASLWALPRGFVITGCAGAEMCHTSGMSPRVTSALLLAPVLALGLSLALWGALGRDRPPHGGASFESPRVEHISFDREIRPILSEKCYHCHGVDSAQRKGDLRLDERAAAVSSGAIAPWQPQRSVLVERIRSTDASSVMPPPSSHRALDERERALLERWIAQGARYEPHWAFVPPRATQAPDDRHPIDDLIEARLKKEDLRFSPEADRVTLLRRVTLDLTGLPPSEAEVDAFVGDERSDAYERVVDRLLASPRYGEKQALPWFDAARYADSNGFQQDGDTFQWMWRDWLVESLNRDVPYDQLSTEMLAGDLLPNANDQSRLATAFLRNHLLNGEGGAIPEENRWITLFDRVDATATTWLGLTVSCAQCHDHKYDPITQRDYYALLDVFNRVSESGIVDHSDGRFRLARPWIEPANEAQRRRRGELESAVEAAVAGAAGASDQTAPERDRAKAELDRFMREEWPRVMTMSDDAPRETRVLSRGEYLSPMERVTFATPAFLPTLPESVPQNRLGLARWLFDEANPLTARVAVNRAWQTFFGDGLVRTPEDFGVQGDRPIHQDVLDTLAVRLRQDGWSMKRLHRLIVTSRAYRQSSAVEEALLERDPENRLLARAPRFRLPAMVLRDVALATSGLLVERVGGAPVYPVQPANVWEPLAITKERDFTYPTSSGDDAHRRSLYTFWRRTIAPANMFDASQRQRCTARVAVTTSPLHALTMLNDPTWIEAARALAVRVSAESPSDDRRVARAFQLVTGRLPSDSEVEKLVMLLEEQRDQLSRAADGTTSTPQAADAGLAAVCLAILNLDEAMTRE
jgi:hypothetical protein